MDENDELEDNLDPTPEEKIIPVNLDDGQRAVKGMYEDWFLDYASYVILERAVPHINDGLKPVQRRFLHAMKEMDDGRYNKVANVIGSTMQYHPHGDAAIGGITVLGTGPVLEQVAGCTARAPPSSRSDISSDRHVWS